MSEEQKKKKAVKQVKKVKKPEEAKSPKVAQPSVEKLSRAEKLIYFGNTAFVLLGIASYLIVVLAYLTGIHAFLVFFIFVPVFYQWAVSAGVIWAALQGFYGLLQYIRSDDKLYLNHCWSALGCAWAYFVLFIFRSNGLYIEM